MALSLVGTHPISFSDKKIVKAEDIANAFNAQYNNLRTHKAQRVTKLKALKLSLADCLPFIPLKVEKCSKLMKPSKALVPDGLCTVHLKLKGSVVIDFLTDIFSRSLSLYIIPQLWKNSVVSPP